MPWSIEQADTNYDNTHPWDSLFNGPPPMPTSAYTQQLMDQAWTLANPETPASFIRDTMTHPPLFDWGPERPQPTIDSVLNGQSLQPVQANFSDFTGTPSGAEASPRNNISIGS